MIDPTPELLGASLVEPVSFWQRRVQGLARAFVSNLEAKGVPPLPTFAPWDFPHWVYHPHTVTVYYPNVEGQLEETLGLQADLLGTSDLSLAREVTISEAPARVAHELFHHWRVRSGQSTHDLWHEECVASTLALAYSKLYEPAAFARVLELTTLVLSRPENQLDAKALGLLESILSSSGEEARGYGIELRPLTIVKAALVARLARRLPSLDEMIGRCLTPGPNAC